MVNVPVFIDGGSKETVAEEKKGGKFEEGGDCLDGTSKRRKRESEGNEIILRHKEDEEKNHSR